MKARLRGNLSKEWYRASNFFHWKGWCRAIKEKNQDSLSSFAHFGLSLFSYSTLFSCLKLSCHHPLPGICKTFPSFSIMRLHWNTFRIDWRCERKSKRVGVHSALKYREKSHTQSIWKSHQQSSPQVKLNTQVIQHQYFWKELDFAMLWTIARWDWQERTSTNGEIFFPRINWRTKVFPNSSRRETSSCKCKILLA